MTKKHYYSIIACHIVLFLVSIYSFITIELFPFTDYFNHLARHYIIHQAGDNPAIDTMYQLHWQISPYLILDWIVDKLQYVTDIYTAGRASIILSIALLPLGTILLQYQIQKNISWSTILIYPFLFNLPLALGFINFIFGLGVALISLAIWLRYQQSTYRYAIISILFLINFFVHAITFGCLVLTLLSLEFFKYHQQRLFPHRHYLILALLLLPEALLWLLVPSQIASIGTTYGNIGDKFIAFFSPISFLHQPLDYLLYLFFALLLITRSLTITPRITPTLIVLTAIAVATPTRLFGIFFTDIRLPIFIILLLIASSQLSTGKTRIDRLYFAILLTFVLAISSLRHSDNVKQLTHCEHSLTEFQHALRSVDLEPTTPLLSIRGPKAASDCALVNGFDHIANLAIIENHLFSPDLFTVLPPTVPQPSYRDIDVTTSPRIDWTYFSDPEFNREHFPYLANWESDFNYIIWFHYNQKYTQPYPFLEPLHTGSFFTIFKNTQYRN